MSLKVKEGRLVYESEADEPAVQHRLCLLKDQDRAEQAVTLPDGRPVYPLSLLRPREDTSL